MSDDGRSDSIGVRDEVPAMQSSHEADTAATSSGDLAARLANWLAFSFVVIVIFLAAAGPVKEGVQLLGIWFGDTIESAMNAFLKPIRSNIGRKHCTSKTLQVTKPALPCIRALLSITRKRVSCK